MAKHPGGRPSKYKPEYCEQLIDHMASGLSFESFAGTISVCDDTLYEWEKKHPEFSAAKKQGFAKNRVFWERLATQHITHTDSKFESTPKLNSTVWIFNMKNRFPKQWRDQQQVEQTIKIDNETIKEMSDDELMATLEKKLKKLKGESDE